MTARTSSRAATRLAASKASKPIKTEPAQLSSPPATPQPAKRRRTGPKDVSETKAEPNSAAKQNDSPPTTSKRTSAKKIKIEHDELPHNLGSEKSQRKRNATSAATKQRGSNVPKKSGVDLEQQDVKSMAAKVVSQAESPKKKEKNNKYGLTPGQTPYPDWPHPTPEECHEVTRLLSAVHGNVKAPKTIPTPSLEVSGCGEVPSVLDALIRTRLSAATSGTNSSRAFQGLVQRFGVVKGGIGKGSVDWNAVRQADVKDIFEAIKCGGLADVKSKDIKKILQMVYEENQARREALLSSDTKNLPGSNKESSEEKKAEIERAEENIVSLDHLHLVSNDEAFDALTKYPGIGPKTASCVLLFCLQRPSFAVDTHVFRLCKWLGWVPPDKATRNNTYAHCDVRIPDELKYPLHYLFIKHGKTCGRCRAITGESSADWKKGCPIEHLVTRTGARKGGGEGSPKKGTKRKTESDSEDEAVETDEDSESDASNAGSVKKGKVMRKQPARRRSAKSTPAKVSYAEQSSDSDAESEEYVD